MRLLTRQNHRLLRFGLAVLLLIVTSMQIKIEAQTRIPRELHFGAIGGANLSQYTFHPSVSQKMAASYTAGIAARYIEETFFGLQAELLLTQRIYADDNESWPEKYFERSLTYLELPVLAHVYFKMGERNEVSLDLGPKLAYFLTDKVDTNLDLESLETIANGQDPEHIYTHLHHTLPIDKNFDYGIQVGLGYEFKFNRRLSLQVQGRYYFGLANLWPDAKTDDFEQSSNQSIQIVMSVWWHHIIKGKKVKNNR